MPSISSLRRSLLLAVLPISFVALLFLMRGNSLPFWQSFNLDPDYYYLLNGLRIVEGLAPTDVSHPGTPVQSVIALTIRAMHPLASRDAVVNAVLADPEGHLLAATAVIYAMVGFALWFLGRSAWMATGALMPAILAQTAPFLSRVIPKFALHPKPEPFLIIAMALLLAVALPMINRDKVSDRRAILAGIVLGLGIACKIHFVVLGVIPLLLLDRRRFALYCLSTLIALMVFVIPALPSLDIWLDWIQRIVLHSGAYGEGGATVINTGSYPRAVLKLFSSKLIFSAILVLSVAQLVLYVRLRRRGLLEPDGAARLLAGIIAAQVLTVLAVAKQPAAHYMIPALLLTGPAMALLWVLSRRVLRPRNHGRVWLAVAVVLVVAQAPQMIRQNEELADWTRQRAAFDMARFAGCAKVYYDAASAQSYAFQRGDMNAQGRYSTKLAHLFPTDEFTWFTNDHTWWKRSLMQWNRPVSLSEIVTAYPCVVFRGNQPWTMHSELARLAPDIKLHDHCAVDEEEIDTIGVACDGRRSLPGR